jgi:hypothetical protein
MVLLRENRSRKARRRDPVKLGLGWDTPLAASMCDVCRHSLMFSSKQNRSKQSRYTGGFDYGRGNRSARPKATGDRIH